MRTLCTRNFLKHSRLTRLDALGFDTPCFSYTLIKLAHRADFISFTKKQTHEKKRFCYWQNLNFKYYDIYKQITVKILNVSVFGLCLLQQPLYNYISILNTIISVFSSTLPPFITILNLLTCFIFSSRWINISLAMLSPS